MQWLNDNSGAINAVAAIATLFVWLFYAQLLYANYSRQTRPKLIINRSAGKDLDSLCLVSNMSSEAIYLMTIVGVVEIDKKTYVADITDHARDIIKSDESDDDTSVSTFQGPIGSGGYYLFPSFRQIIGFVLDNDVGQQQHGMKSYGDVDYIEIRVVAIYGSENRPVGVYRRFKLDGEGEEVALTPKTFNTVRLSRRWDQGRVRRWLKQVEPGYEK